MTMKYATLDLGTIEAVFNKLGGLEGANRFLSGAAEVVLKNILSLVNDKIVSDAIKIFVPHVFYQMRDGLWISDSFRDNVLFKAGATKNLPMAVLKSFRLTKDASDRGIMPCLSQNYEFDISEALARIAQMIEQQSGGKEGNLLNNGYANLFYVPCSVVFVRRNADNRTWNVGSWLLDGNVWGAGCRIFVRN
jgi:hypothetical protein